MVEAGQQKMPRQQKQELVDRVGFWWHSIDLGDGVITPGRKTAAQLALELEAWKLPAFEGKTVLDIGAWDGFYSFHAEKAGARRVVALDYHAWGLDSPRQRQLHRARIAEGRPSVAFDRIPGVWNPGTLPGKAGFDTAHQILGSNVEQMVADFMAVEPDVVGSHDIVLFLGVLYHVREPLSALRRVALWTREVAVIETAGIHVPRQEDVALLEFYESDELNGDASNWWAPNLLGLTKLCRAAGFREVKPVAWRQDGSGDAIERYRLTVHALK
jgi:tRNA (mo5U34)-methyltransferase